MRLYEFEGKELFRRYGIPVPHAKLVDSAHADEIPESGVVKAQILAGKRGKAGAIKVCASKQEIKNAISSLMGKVILHEEIKSVLIEEKITIDEEIYMSIAYDNDTRGPVLILSKQGGIDVEELAQRSGVVKKPINALTGLFDWQAREAAVEAGFKDKDIMKVAAFLVKLYTCFVQEDARLAEINPVAKDKEGNFIALDAVVDLDDDAGYKHKDRNYKPRTVGIGREPTSREIAVKHANDADYRGTVKYLKLDGDIGFMAAGGGGSITCMDALESCGGKPSNYTEFSGNPSAEKLYELTKAILSKQNLSGLWIVGAIANFTRVDTTMDGITRALDELKPTIPIVVRRSGPFEQEGLAILRECAKRNHLNMELFGAETPMTATAKIIVEKSKNYKKK
ncbi:MAG: acetate--CoA ligase family protein [Candidatus Aenigmarchaeota archaeon]|nr:acetate--CoA ligase family protein [Candidatus Aenigmarchaeota archaeon]